MPSIDTSRRKFLAGSLVLSSGLLSGCTSDFTTGGSSPAPSLHFQMESIGQSLVEHYVVDLEETRIEWDEDAFSAALEESNYTTQFRRPFPLRSGNEPAYTRHDGSFYELDSVIVGEERVSHPVLRLFRVGRQGESADLPNYTAQEELPRIDQHGVQIAHMAARARGNEGGFPVGLVERGGFVYRSPDHEDESRLVSQSGPDHVGFRDVIYRVEVSRETFYEPVHRPEINPVADSEEEMEAVLRGAFVDSRLDPASLSQEERQIIRNARGGGYEETHPFSDAFVSLLKALDRREFIDGNIKKDARHPRSRGNVVRYGSEYFDYFLRLDA